MILSGRPIGTCVQPTRRALLALACLLALCWTSTSAGLAADSPAKTCIILTGLGGMPEFEENFEKWGDQIQEICGSLAGRTYRLDGRQKKRADILQIFQEVTTATEKDEVWTFLVGHANFDGRYYKFNVSGPDLTHEDLSSFLEGLKSTRAYLVAATSSSGVLADKLAGPGRVIVTATRSAAEKHPPLFISFFIEAATSEDADTNKDGRISLQEAFSFSETRANSWYEEKGRLQTEHPRLDEPEDQKGLSSMAYLSAPPEPEYRTPEARQLASQKVRLEREIEDLKLRKSDMSAQRYLEELENLLLQLAELNQEIRALEGSP